MKVPKSAAYTTPPDIKQGGPQAYIINPIKDRAMLTPGEALDAISKLSTMLLVDERYRSALEARRALT